MSASGRDYIGSPTFIILTLSNFAVSIKKGLSILKINIISFQQYPPGDCQLEMIFPTIGRIADVAWLSQKIVFEIQCSPIFLQELSRNRDYQKEGWSLVDLA